MAAAAVYGEQNLKSIECYATANGGAINLLQILLQQLPMQDNRQMQEEYYPVLNGLTL